ncbi:DUF4192 domain-containing protein [Nocardia huaxiensis]|uniref:DUF4192 domain-containing protein n=1 Tax=Nocardia huaxiensis TaxID=2755382 RepID=UPI001E3FA508|nr:DUF4192 domain-containing protein [Nocardia huaxiensis]UFS97007.1 DUF4192 domain-containing protein [Nocardia huaxiensis]
MTTPAEPAPPESGDTTTEFADAAREPELHLRHPGDFIAAVPAMLGFAPERSLVVTVLRPEPDPPGSAAVDMVARLDMEKTGRAETVQLVERVAALCLRHRAVAVLALIVDDRATRPTKQHYGVRSRKHRDLVAALEHRLDVDAVPVAGAWAVRAIGADLEWWSVSGPKRHGIQSDPAASLITVRHVLEGRPMRGSREELTAAVAVDGTTRAAVMQAMAAAETAAADRLARAVRSNDPDSYTRGELRKVLWQLSTVDKGVALQPQELAEVAVALRDSTVRDVMFALAPGAHADAAEALWLQLTRALPDPDRAQAATLLGYNAYARGDGPLAGVALDAALASDPDHRMAILLDTALQTGMSPDRLGRLADTGRSAAADLGINLDKEGPE